MRKSRVSVKDLFLWNGIYLLQEILEDGEACNATKLDVGRYVFG